MGSSTDPGPRRFFGGGWVAISRSGMPIGFTSPMMVMDVDEDGIQVSVRWKWMVAFARLGYACASRAAGSYPIPRMRNMFRSAAASGFTEPTWTSAWDEIERARLDSHSVIVTRRTGHPCWFSASRREMREIAVILEVHEVEIERVEDTYDERRSMWW